MSRTTFNWSCGSFAALAAIISLALASQGNDLAQRRQVVYAVCATVIVLAMIAMLLDWVAGGVVPRMVWYGETAALIAFGVSWLTASRTLPVLAKPEERPWGNATSLDGLAARSALDYEVGTKDRTGGLAVSECPAAGGAAVGVCSAQATASRAGRQTAGRVALVVAAFAVAACTSSPPDLPPYATPSDVGAVESGLKLRYYGTSTVLFTSPQTSILVDGFFSRPSYLSMLLGMQPDLGRIGAALSTMPKPIDTVLVAHAHHDHAMDVGPVASFTRASVYGSPFALQVARGWKPARAPSGPFARRFVEQQLHPMDQLPEMVGDLRLQAVATPHLASPFLFQVPQEVRPEPDWQMPRSVFGFKHDTNYSFVISNDCVRVLVVASAGLQYQASLPAADVVLLSIGGMGRPGSRKLEYVAALWRQVAGAKVVFLIHWDDFAAPFPMGGSPSAIRPFPGLMDDPHWTTKQIQALIEDAQKKGLAAPRLLLLPPTTEVAVPAFEECPRR